MSHIGLEDLGLLAEGRVEPLTRARMCEHLARCRACMASYADAVRYHAAWVARPGAFDPSPDLIAAGISAGESAAPGPRVVLPARAESVAAPRRVALAAAAACAVVAAAILLGAGGGDTLLHPWQRTIPAPIRTALESASAVGFVLPGGERAAASRGPVYRGSPAAENPRLEAALQQCLDRYESGRVGPVETYAAGAGFIATGQLLAARELVNEGLTRYPDDPRLLVLAADVAFRMSQLGRSEELLRKALRARPDDPIAALDLGLVLADQGRAAEARREWLAVIAARPGTPLADRAGRELARLR